MRVEIQRALIILSLFLTMGCQPSGETVPATDSLTPSSGSVQTTINNQIVISTSSARSIPYATDQRMSYCESRNGIAGTYSGIQDRSLYPLASLSKLFVSAWALRQLGPDFKFKTILRYKKVGDGVVDAALSTGYDPVVNIEKIFYLLALLKQQNITGIRNLYIDSSTRVYLSVLNNPHTELVDVPVTLDQSAQNLQRILNSENWSVQSAQAQQNLKNLVSLPTSFFVKQVLPLSEVEFKNLGFSSSLEVSSSLLAKYLKNINTQSNNYITDALFDFLGGEKKFLDFQLRELGLKKTDLIFRTGSGLPMINSLGRFDNKASCYAVLKVLKYLDGVMKVNQLNAGHIMMTAGVDQGTYESLLQPPLIFNKNIVFKTGRLYDVPALNLAGLVSLPQKQTLYFAILFHDFDNLDELSIKNQRDQLLASLLKTYKTESNFLTMTQDTLYFSLQ